MDIFPYLSNRVVLLVPDQHLFRLYGSHSLFMPITGFSKVKTAVIQSAEANAVRLLKLGNVRIGWVVAKFESMQRFPGVSDASGTAIGL